MPHPRRLIPLLAAATLAMVCPSALAGDKLVFAFEELLPWKTRNHGVYGGAYTEIVREPQLRSYADLTGLRIGVTSGATYFAPFDSDKALTKDEVPQAEANFRKLALGRIDAVVAPEDQGEAQVARLALRNKLTKAAYRVPDPSPRSIAVSKKSVDTATLEKLEHAMEAMVRDGTLAALIKRHYYETLNVPVDSVRIR